MPLRTAPIFIALTLTAVGLLGFSQSVQADISTGLVGHYTFNEGSGTTAGDSSGNNNTGTLTNGPTWVAGKIGSALDFSGNQSSGSYVDLPNIDVAGSTLTLSAWIKSDNLEACSTTYADCRIIAKASTSNEQDHLWAFTTIENPAGNNTYYPRFRLKAGGVTTTLVPTSGALTNSSWYHIAATYDGAMMRLYVNGTLAGSVAKTGSLNTNSSVDVNIARNPDGYGEFDGAIDDARIYNRALSASDVTELYNYTGGPADTTAPSVSLTAPTGGTTVSGFTAMSASASDNVGVTQVEFLVDGVVRGTDTTAPYSISWDTTNGGTHTCTGPHTHSLTARARDAAGNTTISSAITVNMNDPAYCSDTTSPSMPTSLFATAQSSSQINLSWTASTDNVGVTGYRLERCTGSTCTTFTQIATPTGTSYSDTGLTANTTYRYRVRAVDAAGNLSSYSSIVNGTTQSGSVGGSYPNQPAGFLSVAEYNANVMPVAGPTNSSTACASEGVLDGCWWSSSGSTLLSVVSESTAPQSPTGTFQFKYPSGQQPGNGVGILQGWDTQYETSNTEYREVYESGWVRTVGSTFENQAVGTKMLGYWGVGESAEGKIPTQIYQVSIGNGATSPMSSWNIRFAQQGPDPISRSLSQTAGGAVWTAGVWHRYEIYMKLNDIDAANGLLKVWWNGTLVLDYGDVQWRNAANPDGFYGRRIAPIWGGLGGSNKTRDDFLQYDHIYISGVPMNAPTDTTAPPLRPFSPPRYNPPPKSTSLGLPQPTPNPVSPTTSFIGLYREYV